MSKKVKEILVVGFEIQESKSLSGDKVEIVEVKLNTGDRVQIGKVIKPSWSKMWQSHTNTQPVVFRNHLTRMLAITNLLNSRY